MAHQSFAAAIDEEEVTFTIGNDDFTFRAAPPSQVPAGSLLKIVATAMASEDEGASVAQATVDFLDGVLYEESAKHFGERLTSADNPITLQQVGELTKWLVSQYAGNPTDGPSPSPPGLSPTGMSSTASSSSTPATS